MGILDRFRYVTTTSGRKIPMSKIGKFIIKVYVDGKWVNADVSEYPQTQRDTPIYQEEIDDIDLLEGVRCVILSKDGEVLGDLWRKSPSKKGKKATGELDDIERLGETFIKVGETFDKVRRGAMGLFPEITEMKRMYERLPVEESKSPRDTLREVISTVKEDLELYKELGIFPNIDRTAYPLWAKLAVDKDLREGIREYAVDFIRDAGKALGEGYREGIKSVEEIKKTEAPEEPVLQIELPKVEEPEEKFVCEKCGKSFKSEMAKRGHMKVHKGEGDKDE